MLDPLKMQPYSDKHTSLLCQQYLARLYKNCLTPKPKIVSETYGEILHESVTRLFPHISLNDQDVLFDLGSGIGKLAIQFFLQTNIKSCVGIEISSVLHAQALDAAAIMKKELPQFFS